MLDPGLINDMTEMISKSLKACQIDEIGRLIMKKYNSHEKLGIDPHITVPKRKAAESLISECIQHRHEDKLVKFLIEVDGSNLMGKAVKFDGLEKFMRDLATSGYVYDFKKRKLKKVKEETEEMPGWGALREGKTYNITIASIDIVGNSELVKKHGLKRAEKLYYSFWKLLRRVVSAYEGRIWSWAGDGGLVAFAFKNHPVRASLFALELQNLLQVFNVNPNRPVHEKISLRIGMDTGPIKFSCDTGQIVSDTINYAAHLEKTFTIPETISISDTVRQLLPVDLQRLFREKGEFEGRLAYSSHMVTKN